VSSKYVRDLVEEWLGDVAMVIPYYPTINEEQNPDDDMWCSAEFGSNLRDTVTFCGGTVIEEGEIVVDYLGQAGKGDDVLLTALEVDMITLMAKRDPANKLVLTQRSAPFEFSGGSADRWYGLSIYVDYQFYE